METKKQIIAFKTIAIKEFLRFIRIWVQTILPPVIMMCLYFVIFGTLIGSQIDSIGGFTYIEFIVPGLIMMAVITNSYSNVVSSFFQSKMFKNIEELIISPISEYVIILGFISGGILRGLIIAFFVTIVSMFFTSLNIFNIIVIFLVVTLTAVLFSLAGLVNGIYAKNFDDVNIVPTFVLTPLTYLGGIFYSTSQLPQFWQYVSYLNPILYMVNAFRYGFLGISDVNLWISFSMIIIFILVLFFFAVHLLRKGIGIRN
ncbi:MAG: ABC transporter permease [Nanoarchaeota archaeon]|nr:ABC transporter permease [Nanoarchaeota archaeon]